MSLVSPRYQSLADQVSARITQEIEKGTWLRSLPGERALIEFLCVSRKTLRKALKQLQQEGLIETQHGIGHRIVQTARPSPQQNASVGLLIPDSIENLRHFTALWVYELQILLFENNIRLVTFSGHRLFSHHPEIALARLIKQNPQTCWVLSHTNKEIQKWFYSERLPCVIAGTCHYGLALPNVDINYRATCRHAVGAMLNRGHRRVAYLTPKSLNAGDLEGEAGFTDGVQTSLRSGLKAMVIRHEGTTSSVARELERRCNGPAAPTAILVNNPANYLAAALFLSQRGLRIGKDVSLVSSDDDLFLSYLIPEPARYVCNFRSLAKEIYSLVLPWVRGEQITKNARRVETRFVPGASLSLSPDER